MVFKGLNVEIQTPFTGIVGINGAGKTTLVKLSLHLLAPLSGKIWVNGHDMTTFKGLEHARVGVLHENPRFPPWIRVFEHLVWVGRTRGLSKTIAREQASLILHELDLLDRWNASVNELSAGLRQRFGLAQAFIGLPELVFLDEPTANLDPLARVKILEYIKQITNEHETQVILFSHILSDLEKYCEEVVVLHEGEIKYQADILTLFQDFQSTEFLIRFPRDQRDEIIRILHEQQITILDEQAHYIIIQSNETQAYGLQQYIKSLSITPYKSVLEQAFQDLVQKKTVSVRTQHSS